MARGGYRDVLRFENLFRMGILWTLAVILSYLKLLFQKASSGIGKATAEALALHGYHVILAGRSMNRLQKVKRELTRKHGSISIEALELDLCSAKSILSFKHAVETSLQDSRPTRQLQLLVNNAGILASSQRWTEQGFDSMMASNYLGPYFLTQQLLPILRKGPHARVVNVSSFTHRCVKNLNIGEKQLARGSLQSPSETKYFCLLMTVCILLFTYELHRRLSQATDSSKITVLAADPGIVKTNIMRELPNWLEVLAHFVLQLVGLLQSPQSGANAVIDAALAPMDISGQYFFGGCGRILESSFLSYNSDLHRQLWEASSSVCNAKLSRDDN